MAEVPTVRVDSLHEACDKRVPAWRGSPPQPQTDVARCTTRARRRWCEFPVADRPNAVAAWLRSADAALGEWIYMIETDYVWMAALPPPAPESLPLAFHFHYINPQWPGLAAVIKRGMWDGETGAIPCTGPAPVLIRKAQLQQLMPKWEQYAAWIESDAEAKERLGWVREMYAYSVAAAAEGVRHNVQEPSTTVLISQPPADDSLREATAFHYTWGSQFKNASGGVVWEFDKRPFTETKHVRRIQEYAPTLPPADAAARGLKLQDGKPVTAELLAVETAMLRRMRDAIAQLPNLPDAPGCGWLDSEPKCAFGCLAGILCVPEGRTFKLPGE